MLPKVVGTNNTVELHSGYSHRVIYLNNAATTPPFEKTLSELNIFFQTYGPLHRGAGPNATITCNKIEESIQQIKKFINLPESHTLLFTQNTSSSINLLARLLHFKKTDIIITSSIEHTSNYLPWLYNTSAKIIEIQPEVDGSINNGLLEELVKKYKNKLKLISLTGASNMTGFIPDIKKVSEIAHKYGVLLFIDAAQLAPHRKIDMINDGIDALAFSAHKVYAPFGLGVLALSKRFLDSVPVDPGGGSIEMISPNKIIWSPLNERHQTGTWNVTGIFALATSCKVLIDTGFNVIEKHEHQLAVYLSKKLSEVPGISLYIPTEKYLGENRIASIPFNLNNIHYSLLSAILEHEFAIETRSGTICNHRLVRNWFSVTSENQEKIEDLIERGNRLASYGVVRVSLGIHNTKEDIDILIEALNEISTNGPKLIYKADSKVGIYAPVQK